MGGDRGLIARYERLAALAEREAAAAASGDADELLRLVAEREALVAQLPPAAPQGAREALQRALNAQQAAAQLLRAGLADTRAQLVRMERGGAQLRAYGGVPAHVVDASS